MHHSQLISDLSVLDSLHGRLSALSAHPVVVLRGDGSMGGLGSDTVTARRSTYRQTLCGLGDYLDDPFVDAIRSAALQSECDEDDRPTLPTPIPAVVSESMPVETEVRPPPVKTRSRRRHAVLLDGVHDFVAAAYLKEAESIAALALFPAARPSLRQRVQSAFKWLTRGWSAI